MSCDFGKQRNKLHSALERKPGTCYQTYFFSLPPPPFPRACAPRGKIRMARLVLSMVVHFTRGQSPAIFSYSVNDTIISTAGSQKDHGVIMSSDMQWRSLFIIPRAYRMLGLIRRVFSSSTDVYTKRCLYLSLVRSKLLYCSPVWRPQYLVDIRNLETVQRRASKFIISNSAMDYRDRLISLEMLPLMMEYEIADIMFLIKSLKNPSSHLIF